MRRISKQSKIKLDDMIMDVLFERGLKTRRQINSAVQGKTTPGEYTSYDVNYAINTLVKKRMIASQYSNGGMYAPKLYGIYPKG